MNDSYQSAFGEKIICFSIVSQAVPRIMGGYFISNTTDGRGVAEENGDKLYRISLSKLN
ncbi:hypothetical protein [Paenibacillus sp. Soil522]|uniref:hypothetical protein n=1 Tax=Paenibacillus sp. Soil522 TaxID=1736388 RepID=UPI000AF2005F|nr:hypothetical protein [Paenibacillus sp. Soil522]